MTDSSTSHCSDEQLVAAVLTGDLAQFAPILARYRSAMLWVARSRLGDAVAAEDVVQEACLHAFQYLESFNPQYTFKTWLWTILIRQCHQAWRRQQRGSTHRSATGDRPEQWVQSSVQGDRSDPLTQQEQSAALQALLQRLPEPQADAIRLRFFGGLKFQEIADVMQSSLSSAKQRVRLGLVRLSDWIQDDESLWELLAPVASDPRPTWEPLKEPTDRRNADV